MPLLKRKYLVYDRPFHELSREHQDLVEEWCDLMVRQDLAAHRFHIFAPDDPLVRRGGSPVAVVLTGLKAREPSREGAQRIFGLRRRPVSEC
ncbi:MAG: hypothetical protein Kow00109_02510 [Acidobacteriota bacterium]